MSRIQLGCNAFNAGRVGRVTELSRTALRNFIVKWGVVSFISPS